jgi:hypothetical protein
MGCVTGLVIQPCARGKLIAHATRFGDVTGRVSQYPRG